MKERPIIFSAPLVRAILDGRKTMTRRVIKQAWDAEWAGSVHPAAKTGWIAWWPDGTAQETKELYEHGFKCPYGQPGDLLWVRETWGIQGSTCIGKGHQREFFSAPQLQKYTNDYWKTVIKYKASDDLCQKWWPSIHMPKWAARLWLRITNVRVERVQEISDGDVAAEGVEWGVSYDISETQFSPAQKAFRQLWDFLNAKPKPLYAGEDIVSYISYPWEDIQEIRKHYGKHDYPWHVCGNPWVFVVEFERYDHR